MDEWKLEQGSGDGAGVCLARSMVPVLLGPAGDWARRGVGCVYRALTDWALRFAEGEPDSKMGRGGETRESETQCARGKDGASVHGAGRRRQELCVATPGRP